jgi:NodT family efflux transporter outer membrane factor (OMF) lipoprotein
MIEQRAFPGSAPNQKVGKKGRKNFLDDSHTDCCRKGAFTMSASKSSSPIVRSLEHLSTSLVSLVTLIFIVSGCAVGPDYQTPEGLLPQEYEWIDIDAPGIKSESANLARWWTVFNDPVLNALIDEAYQQNLSLRVAGLRILEARANLGIAIGSQYPQSQQVNGGAAAVKLSESDPNTLIEDRDFNTADVSFDLGWELDFWGRFRRAVESESARLDASIADYDNVMVALAAEVARSYVSIRTIEQRLLLAQRNVVIQEEALRIADVRYENGAVTELDVQQARSVLSNTEATVPQLESALRQSTNALAVLLGLIPQSLSDRLKGTAPIPAAPPEVSMGVPAELLRRRPDVRRAERQLAAQSAQIGIAITDLYPRFALAGSVGFRTSDVGTDDGLGNLFESDNLRGFLGPFFSWNILNYGRINNNIRVEDARFQQLLVNYQNTVLSALAETENAIVAYLKAHDQARHLGVSVAAAERSVEISLIQYREGATEFNRVLDSLDFQFQQQDAYSATVGDIATNLITMYKSVGGGYQAGGEREAADYVADEDREQLRSRTRYWRKELPE